MITTNEPLVGIEARIDELQNTIAEKEAQIKERTRKLKEEIEAELSPVELIRKHTFPVTVIIFVTGLLLGKTVRKNISSSGPVTQTPCPSPKPLLSNNNRGTLSTIGLEALRTAKDLGFTYLQRYIDKKIT